MTITKFRVGMAALLVLGIAALFVIVGYAQGAGETLNCPSGQLGIYDVQEGVNVECVNAPFATLTPVVDPTDTPVPPTDTPIPDTPVPPTDIPPTDTPVPPLHDDRAWHPVSADISHEHKANPHDIDDVFGTGFYSWAGGEISYPWQTFKGAGEGYPTPPPPGDFENDFKHEGYGWATYDAADYGQECFSALSDLCVMAYRLQYHAIMAAEGAVTRFHSYWLEVLVCDEANPDTCGIVRTGGWVDYGCLFVDLSKHVPLPNDPDVCLNKRFHASQTVNGQPLSGGANLATWYGLRAFAQPGIRGEVWGGINPNDPFEPMFVCPDYQCNNNGSFITGHLISGRIPFEYDEDGDGLANFVGYTDRHGVVVEGCSAVGLDCVPLRLENIPIGSFQWRDDTHKPAGNYEGDISPDGEWWIEYPN